jgi:hypothetical protein
MGDTDGEIFYIHRCKCGQEWIGFVRDERLPTKSELVVAALAGRVISRIFCQHCVGSHTDLSGDAT